MFYLNDIVEVTGSGTRYRILYLDYASDSVWLFPLFGKYPLPVRGVISGLENDLASDKIIVAEAVEQTFRTQASPSAARKRDAAFDSIKPLIGTADIFVPSKRNLLINARATELKCSPRTLIKTLRRYWAGGQTRNGLLPKFHKRGNSQGRTNHRGRPPKFMDRDIYQVQEEDLQNFKRVIETKYLKGVTATIAGTYHAMLREYYSVIDSEGELQPRFPGEFPSIEQFRRFFKSKYSTETIIRNREGNAEFELNHRPKLGNAELSVFSAGDNYEIDATIADVFLVSSADRRVIVGKPTLYLIIDSKSWLIVGFYVGFEQPSWPAALHAISSIGEDKKALCERYGVPYHESDWPAHGVLPKELTGDRGEMLSNASTAIAAELEITIKNVPSKMANRKPHVECGFKLIQRPMAEFVPGYEPPENFKKRQGKHYDKDACLTLDEFTTIILRSIIRFNNTARDGYPLSPAQTLSGLIPTPCNIWNHEIRNRAGALPRYSANYLQMALLPRDTATVTRDGIEFHGCYYSCQEAINRGWFVRSERGSFKVKITYDRRLVDTIYIHDDENPGQFFTAMLLEKSSHFAGMSYLEVDAIIFARERIRQEGRHDALRQNLIFHTAVDPVTTTAKAETHLLTNGKSRSSRKADIRDNRAEERKRERQEKAATKRPEQQKTADVVPLHNATLINNVAKQPHTPRNAKLLDMLNGY